MSIKQTHKRAYTAWCNMKSRCNYPGNDSYSNYGAKGITYCESWEHFSNFLEDMGDPKDGMSIDRIDNDGNYSPENCRWATRTQQNNNKSTNKFLKIGKVTRTMSEWAREYNIDYYAVKSRIRLGWNPLTALTAKINKRTTT